MGNSEFGATGEKTDEEGLIEPQNALNGFKVLIEIDFIERAEKPSESTL